MKQDEKLPICKTAVAKSNKKEMQRMIYTVTLNPAVDYTVYMDELKRGEINRSRSENIFFGGKGINVSNVLKSLGVKSTALGFSAGFTGFAIEDDLSKKGITADFVHLKNGFTRINVKLREGVETDINTAGPQIDENETAELFEKLDRLKNGDVLVLSGSVPKCMPSDTYEQILKRLSPKEVRVVVDAEGKLLENALKYRPFIIKPNAEELGELFDVVIENPQSAAKYAKKLINAGAGNVLVSMGRDGAVLIDRNGTEHFCAAFSGKTVNTVGAGDSMVAGFIAGYERTGDFDYALRLGTAAGSATAFSEGLAEGEHILKLFKSREI